MAEGKIVESKAKQKTKKFSFHKIYKTKFLYKSMSLRKIITKEERERKETRNKLILGIILVGVMLISTAGYAFISGGKTEEKKIIYNSIKFQLYEDGLWHAQKEGIELATLYNPKETENISISFYPNLNDYSSSILYYEYDSKQEGMDEINRNIGRFSERAQFVCINECEADWPVKNCSSENIISLKEANLTKIERQDKCIYITAPSEEIVKAADSFIFRTFGVY